MTKTSEQNIKNLCVDCIGSISLIGMIIVVVCLFKDGTDAGIMVVLCVIIFLVGAILALQLYWGNQDVKNVLESMPENQKFLENQEL